MNLWKKKASSSPSSPSPNNSHLRSSNSFENRPGCHGLRPQLTRARKLRHVEDEEVGLGASNRPHSSPVSPESTPRSSCPARLDQWSSSPAGFEHWSYSAVPQPLPLPESFPCRKDGLSAWNSRECSRKDGTNRGEGDEKESLMVEGAGESPSSKSAVGNEFDYQCHRKSTGHVATKSAKSPADWRWSPSQAIIDGSVNHNLRLKIPTKDGYSSLTLNPHPQRLNTSDFYPSSSMSPHELQKWSAMEIPTLDKLAGYSSHAPPVRMVRSTGHSPLNSPPVQSPRLNPKSPRAASSPTHNNFLPENSMPWVESTSYVNGHPLPLPPGALVSSQTPTTLHTFDPGALGSSQTATIHHTIERPIVSSMKGQWKKGKLIGRGTFGSVYIATNRETGALCAMKEVDVIPDDPKSAECIKQLEQEIKVLRQLKHQNIVQYYGSEKVDDHFYIYLEYIYPGSINKYAREHFGAITEPVVRNFTRHILSGLAYLHSTKTIHRDIKGANLLVDASGVVKLADFGMAKHLTGLSYELSLKGSPYWMAPEVMQAVMQKDSNPELALAVDIWSLGCTVIEMLDGRPPWSEFEGPQAMFKVLNHSPPIPDTLSSEGKDFLRRCFLRNPAERPSAFMLLEHPFVRNSHEQNFSVGQEISGLNLLDRSHSPRESPGRQIMNGNLLGSPNFSPSSHAPPNLGAANYHNFSFLRTRGREIPHI